MNADGQKHRTGQRNQSKRMKSREGETSGQGSPIIDVSLSRLVDAMASTHGDCQAYCFLDDALSARRSMSYAELAESSLRLARQLWSACSPGDRVLLAFDNGPEAVVGFWACIRADLIPVPAPAPDQSHSLKGVSRLRGIARDAGARHAWTLSRYRDAALGAMPELDWHALELDSHPEPSPCGQDRPARASGASTAYLQYTSGSTRQPKGVEITHAQVLAQCEALSAASRATTGPARSLTWLPWYHDYGLVHGLIQPVAMGMTSFLLPTNRFLMNPLRWLEAIDRHRITHSGGPNFAFDACVRALSRETAWTARLDCWNLATCGAEPVRPATMEAFARAFEPFGLDPAALRPCYGLAEAVLGVTMHAQPSPPRSLWVDSHELGHGRLARVPHSHPRASALTGCGPALPGFDVVIVDRETGHPAAADRVGEIWVAGASVARGYWGQPQATKESFGFQLPDDPHGQARYLRTGDLGFLDNGELFVTGRCKDLIIVNGRNIYPHDLELTAQEAHPGVRAAGVIAVAVPSGQQDSVVLLVECQGRPGPQQARVLTDAVRHHVASEHEIAIGDVLALRSGSLPRTSSGKPMRRHAAELYLRDGFRDRQLVVAAEAACTTTTPVDELVASALEGIWREVLGVTTISADDDFLEQGGDSLMATQLVSRISTRLGVQIPVSTVFEIRRFSRLLEHVGSLCLGTRSAGPETLGDVPRAATESDTPLSFSQERMWFMHQMAPHSSAYHIPLAIRLRGPLDTEAMHKALRLVVHRHDVLRSTYAADASGVAVRVSEGTNIPLEGIRLDGDDLALQDHLSRLSQQAFDLSQGPLLRAQLIHRGPDEAVLALVMHHMVSDQWSCFVIGRELAHHYSAALGQARPPLPEVTLSYSAYAEWHRRWFDHSRRPSELDYWSRKLAGLQPLPLLTDHVRPLQPSFRGASLRKPLPASTFSALAAMAAHRGASLSMALLAALKVLLLRHTGCDDVAVGVPIANRNRLVSEHLVGTFVNTLVLRTDLQGNPGFGEVLERVRDVSLEAFAHQDMPFELLVRELDVLHDPSRSPLFTVLFNVVNTPIKDIEFHGLEWSRLDFDRRATQFDLSVLVDPQHDPGIVFEYATDLFEHSTIDRMASHLLAIIEAALHDAGQPVRQIRLLGTAESQLLADWSRVGSHAPCPDNSGSAAELLEWLARGCQLSPRRPAVVADGQALTHQELHEASDRLAARLQHADIGPGSRVGICMPRTPDLLLAMLSVLKAGAAYVPLDPSYPADRLAYQVADAGLALMLTCSTTAPLTRQIHGGPVWCLDQPVTETDIVATWDDQLRPAQAGDPAYLIYTSGSTGQPKGVVIARAAMLNFLHSMATKPGLAPGERLLAVTTVSFDIAVLELFLPLGTAATVVMASETQAMDGRELVGLIERHGIQTLQATPSRWHLLLEAGWVGHPNMRALVGGEPLDKSLARQLSQRCGQVWNMYGPTETTVWSTCWRVDPDAPSGISLGQPVANTSIHILDADLRACPVGVMGEICIGGLGLALGYHGRPDLTAERFVSVEVEGAVQPQRLYRTGDLGRWRHDGSLEHGGRMDDQVKLRGFRIELGEIEARLATLPGIDRGVVALKDLPGQGPSLVAYLVCPGDATDIGAVRQHLQAWLPDHMIPRHCVHLDAIPLLPNGKTDRNALPMPLAGKTAGRSMEMPRNHAEQMVWEAWCDLLGTRQLGIHDHFFDVGGHSMLAIRLASRLERDLGRAVPLGLIFTHATIASCAEQLLKEGEVPDRPVAILQAQGEGPPLFLLAGADMYRALALALAPDVPVYGLFSETEIALLMAGSGTPTPAVSVRSLALEYLELVQCLQACGPYRLGGISIGGVIAHEVARLLRERGHEVDLLLLMDCALPGRGARQIARGLERRVRQLYREGHQGLARTWKGVRSTLAQKPSPSQRRNQAYAHAIRKHEARKGFAAGTVLFLQAGDDPSAEPGYGWGHLIPGLRVERVPGRHMQILEGPNVQVLARHLRPYLRPNDREEPGKTTAC